MLPVTHQTSLLVSVGLLVRFVEGPEQRTAALHHTALVRFLEQFGRVLSNSGHQGLTVVLLETSALIQHAGSERH